MNQQARKRLGIAKKTIKSLLPNENIIGICITGSVARGFSSNSSDLDILVFLNTVPLKKAETIEIEGIKVQINFVPFNYLKKTIEKYGISLHSLRVCRRIMDSIIVYEKDNFLSCLKKFASSIKIPRELVLFHLTRALQLQSLASELIQTQLIKCHYEEQKRLRAQRGKAIPAIRDCFAAARNDNVIAFNASALIKRKKYDVLKLEFIARACLNHLAFLMILLNGKIFDQPKWLFNDIKKFASSEFNKVYIQVHRISGLNKEKLSNLLSIVKEIIYVIHTERERLRLFGIKRIPRRSRYLEMSAHELENARDFFYSNQLQEAMLELRISFFLAMRSTGIKIAIVDTSTFKLIETKLQNLTFNSFKAAGIKNFLMELLGIPFPGQTKFLKIMTAIDEAVKITSVVFHK